MKRFSLEVINGLHNLRPAVGLCRDARYTGIKTTAVLKVTILYTVGCEFVKCAV